MHSSADRDRPDGGGADGRARGAESFTTSAPHALLLDYDSGSVLFERDADKPVPPASLTKMMTMAIVFQALKDGKISLDDEFVISENAWRRGGAPSHGSAMFAAVHSRVKLSDLLRGVIVQSGNDAAIAIAEGLMGNETAFAKLMTDRAKEIGLASATFRNAEGYPDPDQKISARDLARLATHIIRNFPEYYEIYGEREFTWNKIRQQNRNPLLAMNIGADGLKTGFLKEAGYNLVGSAVQGGQRLIVVVLGARTEKETRRGGAQAPRMGVPQLRIAATVRRQGDHRRGADLRRQPQPGRSGGRRSGAAADPARHQ